MRFISLTTATVLTGLSESTLRRRIAEGLLLRTVEDGPKGRNMLALEALRPSLCFTLQNGDEQLILDADNGNSDSQCDLALLLFEQDKQRAGVYWLELAARQENLEAMHWLGRCYVEGNGLVRDENLGIMWLAKAAAKGHILSKEMTAALVTDAAGGRGDVM